MKVAIYARVSTTDQSCALQLNELRGYCERREWQIAEEYVDTITGKLAQRPALDKLMQDAREHRFAAVCVWKIDRFGRSVKNFTEHLQQLDGYGVRFVAVTQNIDTNKADPMSRLLMHILAAFAEFEREMIVERVKSGMAAAKSQGARCGRPKVVVDRSKIRALLDAGHSAREVARRLGVSRTTVARLSA